MEYDYNNFQYLIDRVTNHMDFSVQISLQLAAFGNLSGGWSQAPLKLNENTNRYWYAQQLFTGTAKQDYNHSILADIATNNYYDDYMYYNSKIKERTLTDP